MARIHSIPGLVVIITLGSLMSSCATQPATVDLESRSQLGLDATAILESTKDPLHGRLVLVRNGPDGKELERKVIADTVLSKETIVAGVRLLGDFAYRDIPTSGSETSQREWCDWRETWTLDWRELRSCVHTLAIAMLKNPSGKHSAPASSAFRCTRRECQVGADRLLETYELGGLRFTRLLREDGTRDVSLWRDRKRLAFLRIKATGVLVHSSTPMRDERHVTFLPCGVGVWPEIPKHGTPGTGHGLVSGTKMDELIFRHYLRSNPPEEVMNSAESWMDELLLLDYRESNPSEAEIKNLWRLVMTGTRLSPHLRQRFHWR